MAGPTDNQEKIPDEKVDEVVEEKTEAPDILSMSDEDFAKFNSPDELTKEPEPEESGDEGDKSDPPVKEEEKPSEGADDASNEQGDQEKKDEKSEIPGEQNTVIPGEKPDGKDTEQKSQTTVVAPSVEEAQSFYTKMMTPFKANGKMIELKTPEEALQLMQMGANYTRKLMDIQPHRKVLNMLQNNNLLDEGKLSYLIDLDKKDPEAIKKLIKDANIDPLDIDVSTDANYTAGSNIVSDDESNFQTILEEVTSTPEGVETVKLINAWDDTSKEAVWSQPDLMSAIHEQRENGIYDLIATEVDRQRTLGQIPVNTPFLQAYQTVGNQLSKQSGSQDTEKQGSDVTTTSATSETSAQAEQNKGPEVVATRVIAPKSQVVNGDKASAASPSKSSTGKAKEFVNPLAMSDDDFLKSMDGRL